MLTQLPIPSAILFDIGGTILEERRFDLEAGIRAVIGHRLELATELARAFRTELGASHRTQRELLLAQWLVERLPQHAPWLHSLRVPASPRYFNRSATTIFRSLL